MLTKSFRGWWKVNKQRFQSCRHEGRYKGLASSDLFFVKTQVGIFTKWKTTQTKDDVISLLFLSHVIQVGFGICLANVTIKSSWGWNITFLVHTLTDIPSCQIAKDNFRNF